MLIREMRSEDKPRERFQESPKMASMTDLVAILLRTGRQGYSVMQLAQDVVDQLEQTVGINGYEDLHWRDLTDIKGIGPDKAVTICAAIELGRRLTYIYDKRRLENFSTPEKVSAFFMERLRHETQEHFLQRLDNLLWGFADNSGKRGWFTPNNFFDTSQRFVTAAKGAGGSRLGGRGLDIRRNNHLCTIRRRQ